MDYSDIMWQNVSKRGEIGVTALLVQHLAWRLVPWLKKIEGGD